MEIQGQIYYLVGVNPGHEESVADQLDAYSDLHPHFGAVMGYAEGMTLVLATEPLHNEAQFDTGAGASGGRSNDPNHWSFWAHDEDAEFVGIAAPSTTTPGAAISDCKSCDPQLAAQFYRLIIADDHAVAFNDWINAAPFDARDPYSSAWWE